MEGSSLFATGVVAAAAGLSGYLLWRRIVGTLRGPGGTARRSLGEGGCAGCPLAAACGRCETERTTGGARETTLVVADLTSENAGRLLAVVRSMEGVIAGEVAPGARLRVTYDSDRASPAAMIAALEAASRRTT